jgi:hypothetical protein
VARFNITGDADSVDGYEGNDLAVLSEEETITDEWTFNSNGQQLTLEHDGSRRLIDVSRNGTGEWALAASGPDIHFDDINGGPQDVLYLQSGGDVGIGTSSPNRTLNVRGNGAEIRNDSNNQNALRVIQRKNDPDAPASILIATDDDGEDVALEVRGRGDGSSVDLTEDTQTSSDMNLQIWSSGKINTDGPVGIGTTSPDQSLDVEGAADLNGRLNMRNNNINNVSTINMNNTDINNVDQVEINGASGRTMQVRGGANTSDGLSVRTASNVPSDRTMFAVESSGGSTRFGVTQNNGGFFRDKLWVESGSNTDNGELNSSDILTGSIRADNGMEIGDPNVGIFPDPFNSGILKVEAINASGTDQIRIDASNNVFIEGRDKVIVGSGRGENHTVGPSYSNQGQETPPGTIFLGPGIRIETHFISQQNGPTPQYTTFLIFNEEGSYDQRDNFFRDQLDDFYIRDILDRSEIALYSTVEGSFGGGGTGDTQIRYIEHQGDGNVDQGGVKD